MGEPNVIRQEPVSNVTKPFGIKMKYENDEANIRLKFRLSKAPSVFSCCSSALVVGQRVLGRLLDVNNYENVVGYHHLLKFYSEFTRTYSRQN